MRTLRHLVQGVLAGWVGPRALFLCETASVEGANQPSFLFNSPPLSVLTFLKLAGRRAIRSDILLVPIDLLTVPKAVARVVEHTREHTNGPG